MKLNIMQEKFCKEFAICGNGYESAKNAGYCSKAVNKAKEENRDLTKAEKNRLYKQGSELLNKEIVQQRIKEIMEKNYKEKTAKLEDILLFLTTMMNNKMADNKDRIKAAELLLRRYPVNEAFEKDPVIIKI